MSDIRPEEATGEARREELRARARKGALWLGSTTVVWQLVNWLLTILTARYLLPRDYGLMALADTVLSYLWIVATLGSNAWLLQAGADSLVIIRSVWTLQLLMGILITSVGLLTAPAIAEFYQNPALVAPFRVVVCAFLLHSIWGMEETLLQRELQFKRVSLVNLAVTLLRGFTQLGLAVAGYGVWALVLGIVLRELAAIAFYSSGIVTRLRLAWSGNTLRQVLTFGLPLTGSSILWVITNTADNIAVGKLFGGGILGLYAMAFYLTDLPLSKLNTVVRPVLIPYLVRLRDSDREAMKRAYLHSSQTLMLLVAPLLVGLGILANETVSVLLGERWLPLIPYLRLMCLVGLLRATVDNVSPMFHALGRPLPQLVHNLLSAIVLPLSFVLLGSLWHVSGVFAAWLFIFPALSYVLLRFLQLVADITPVAYLTNLLPPLIASTVMAGAVFGARWLLASHGEIVHLVVCGAVGALVYWGVLKVAFPGVIKNARVFLLARGDRSAIQAAGETL